MTRMLVRRHRGLIARVAKALLGRTTLTAEELDHLVGHSVDDVKLNHAGRYLSAMAGARQLTGRYRAFRLPGFCGHF